MIHTGINPWLAMLAGGVVVAVLAVPIGIASLRVRGASFVIVSIALVLILLLVFQSWASFTGGSNGLRVPRPFDTSVLRPEQHERFFYLHAALLAVALLAWWAIDRSRFGMGLKAIREDEDKAQSLGVPTFSYKLVAFVVSAFFTALAGGLYALWFGFLDPIFQFSILVGAYMVLMSLLGGIRSLFGPLLGAVIVGYAVEYFKNQYGDTQFHLVAMGLLLGVVVLFMPDGIIPGLGQLVNRFRPQAASIREVSQADLAEQRRQSEAQPVDRATTRRPTPTRTRAPRDRRSPAVTTTDRIPETTAAPSEVNLATEGLSKSFGGVHAVDGATVRFHHGKVNALIGPNGSGKTTFFNCVTGMIRPDAGTVSYRGTRHHQQGLPPDRAGRASAAASSCAGCSRG